MMNVKKIKEYSYALINIKFLSKFYSKSGGAIKNILFNIKLL